MIVISDTSPINYLVLIGKQDILPMLFGQVIIPKAVLRELQTSATPPQVRRWVANRPVWLEMRPPTAPPETGLSHLDEGEREAIQLAEELKADLLIIDERAGREEALKRSLPVIGTLGLLERAAAAGMLDFALVLAELKAHKFFVAPALERDFLERDAQRKAGDRKKQE
jgi:predicted nucleic acid-binding protein